MKSSVYWKGKTIIVSGGMGFIGSHFIEELVSVHANVICLYHKQPAKIPSYSNGVSYIQVDLANYEELSKFCKTIDANVDAFIHCAALDGNAQFKLEYAAEILDANNRFTSNVLKVCNESGIHKVSLLSSAEIYSSDVVGIISEVDDYHKYPCYTDNGYVLSKVFSEMLAGLYSKKYNMDICIPRPTNVYGPRDNFNVTTNRVIPAMIHKVSVGETVEIWGDGKQTRSFIYVKDLVRATLAAIEKGVVGPINMATKDQTSILELASYITKEYAAENLIRLDKSKPVGVKSRLLDVSRMYNIIDFEPLSIKDGLDNTVSWYRSVAKNSEL